MPDALRQGLLEHKVDAILHLGDFTTLEAAEQLAEVAPLEAVAGNNDAGEVRARYGRQKIFSAAGFNIGMIHGDGAKGSTLARACAAFSEGNVQAIAFGHSHVPYCHWHGGVLMINPGSPTERRRNPLYSYAVLELWRSRIRPKLLFFADKR